MLDIPQQNPLKYGFSGIEINILLPADCSVLQWVHWECFTDAYGLHLSMLPSQQQYTSGRCFVSTPAVVLELGHLMNRVTGL